ncbi:hypothetical protein BJY59DRAFT_263140 [Rhodotorula toruloides]
MSMLLERAQLVLVCACVTQPCPSSCATRMHARPRPSTLSAHPPSPSTSPSSPLARSPTRAGSCPPRSCTLRSVVCSSSVLLLALCQVARVEGAGGGFARSRWTEQAKILTRSLAGLVLLVFFNLFAQAGPFAGLAQTADARGHTRPALARLLPTPRVLITLSGYPAEQAGLV